ncbi:MAG TPA: hypothetical protein VGQ55_03855 [Pyrinomonadaceae bacterium]|nr:hypothetical protein [Pyrinomonadaceae bacterium]
MEIIPLVISATCDGNLIPTLVHLNYQQKHLWGAIRKKLEAL